MSERRRGGIKVCEEYAEMIREGAEWEIKLKGRVSKEWVERNKEIALWDERNHREKRFWWGVLAGSQKLTELPEERRKWWERS